MENNKQYVLATDIFNLLLEVRARATRCIGYNHIIHFLAKVLLPIMYLVFSFNFLIFFIIIYIGFVFLMVCGGKLCLWQSRVELDGCSSLSCERG